MDLYQILEINRGASEDEIKKAYKKLAIKHHPDKNDGSKESEEKFKEISNAYQILSDPEKRSYYDRTGQIPGSNPGNSGGDPFGGFDFNDIFSQFGDFFGGGRQTQRNLDLRVKVQLTLDEVLTGVNKKIRYNRDIKCQPCNGQGGSDLVTCSTCQGRGRQEVIQRTPFGTQRQIIPCQSCQGQGKKPKNICSSCQGQGTKSNTETIDVDIPAGALSGMMMNQNGGGNFWGGHTGNLSILIEELPDPKFKRQDLNLHHEAQVSIIDALLGKDYTCKLPTGKEIKIKIPELSEPGKILRVTGKGIPNVQRPGHIGDIYIHVGYKMPTKLSLEEKKILEDLKRKGDL
jgi:molecular chaperone DnaJ